MQVNKLKEHIEQYKKYLQKDRHFKGLYRWEAMDHFQKTWDLDAPDLAAMYDAALQNTRSRRLWKRQAWFPKEMMLKLIALDADFMRHLFRDLFNEEKEITARISRFKFGCDELMGDYKMKHPVSIETNHFHDDFQMVMLYLAFRFPEKYTLFDYPAFHHTMELVGSKDIPSSFDIERFLKITKVLKTFLQKEEEVITWHQRRLPEALGMYADSALLVHDFYTYSQEVMPHK